MRLWIVFLKNLREMKRDLWVVSLTIAFAPCFVFLYWLWFQGGSTTYRVLVLNHDAGAVLPGGGTLQAGVDITRAIQGVTYPDGKPLLTTAAASTMDEVQAVLRARGAAAFIEIPADFSTAILALQSGNRAVNSQVTFGGDLTNPYYTVAASLALTAVDAYVMQATGQKPLIQYVEAPLGASGARSEFETYVPGVLILSVILLIFQAAMLVAREIESGALTRLQLTPLSAFELLGGMTAALMVVAVASLLLTFATAAALGFHSQGPLWVAVLTGACTSLSVIGIGLMVACLTRTVAQAFVVANFPLALLMFFSGAIFPVPAIPLFTLGSHTFSLYDLLPPSHAVAALNKVLTLGAGIQDVAYELGMLALLSVVYFGAGVLMFQKLQLKR
jgi:ABC-2 type transport system permease protein